MKAAIAARLRPPEATRHGPGGGAAHCFDFDEACLERALRLPLCLRVRLTDGDGPAHT
ncbi:MAG TPA: hypothetical protein H9874_03195 [Candidatus Bilophila faecipullorum]|uniref:Uncharacterized protein n=2 Tax=Bilophila TaxID=35832 RepID=A0A9D1U955_9BACT|nr:hypothetical protein [uncultured Bilophila sp.]HIW78136.1 hypothetical protein [Candidatus Bilophila faecipullorum]